MFKKSIVISLVLALLLMVPVTAFASTNVPQNTLSNANNADQLQSKANEEIQPYGFKKDALVFALRYGGDLLADLLDILSKRNADLVRKYSDEIADELDRLENDIEANLIQFMHESLDFPMSAARSIAWAITSIAL